MKSSIFKISFLFLSLIGHVEIGYAQTASILPPAKTTFFTNNGKPNASGTAEFFIPGTSTHKMTWQDAGQTIPNTNPVTLDSSGRALILGDGSYRQVIRDKAGNIIWDQITSSVGSGGGGGSATIGDGDAVGTVKAWSGFTAPYGYTFAYGQELVRTSFPEVFAAITSEQNVTCTLGSPTLTSVGATSQLAIGSKIESSCLNSGATIVSKTASTVVASSNAIISTTTSARFFPYGNGDGSSTFNLPDLRGRSVAGVDSMGGVAANRLSQTYFGTNTTGLGANGGVQSQTLLTSNLPPYTPTGSVSTTTTGSFPIQGEGLGVRIPDVALRGSNDTGATTGAITAASSSTFTGVAQGGTSSPFSVIQPTALQNYIIKIIPDSNPNSFFGVASIGGMYGVIECGTGITCAGNTISAVTSVINYPDATIYNTDPINVPSNEQVIAISRASPVSTVINLPHVSGRNLAPLKILDWSDPLTTNVITINPQVGETIFRLPSWTVYSTSSSRAMITLYPSITLNGWYVQ